jgi:hypothetical protein
MDSLQIIWISLSILMLFLILLAILVIFLILRYFQRILADKKEVELAQVELLSKSVALLSAKDPLSYQAIQVMDQQTTSDSKQELEDIDSLMARDAAGEKLTEEEYARIDQANFGFGPA